MKLKSLLIFGLAVLCACSSPEQVAPQKNVHSIRDAFFNANSDEVLVVAHRGLWRSAPENSLPALEAAIQAGVDIIEIDIRKTKDGQLVLMHDQTLDRTTNGKGNVSDRYWSELQRLHLKNGLGRLTKWKITTLEEAMTLVKGRAMVNLDKCYDYFPEAYTILEKTGTVDHVIMKGWHPLDAVQRDLGEYLDEIIYMPVISLDKTGARHSLENFQRHLSPPAYEFIFSADTSEVIGLFPDLRQSGARVWVNSLWPELCAGHDDDLALSEPDASWGWLLDSQVNIIQTDRPELLISYIR